VPRLLRQLLYDNLNFTYLTGIVGIIGPMVLVSLFFRMIMGEQETDSGEFSVVGL
jgi:hypothetical protein